MAKCKCEFLGKIDMFGKTPEFYYKKTPKKTTLVGRIFTVLYFTAYIGFFIFKLIKMLEREDVTFYDTFAFTGEIPSIHLNNDNFYGGFGILGPTGDPMVNEQIYHASTIFWSGKKINNAWVWDYKIIELERCKIEKFGKKYQHMFSNLDLNNMYCLSNVDVILEGYATSDAYSYFEVKLYPCVNKTKDGLDCYPKQIISQFLKKNQFMFRMQDIELTPQDYKSPIQEREKDIAGPVYENLLQQIYAYMQVTNIETDEDIIGFGLSNIKKEKFLKYDLSWIVTAPMEGDIYTTGDPFSVIYVQLSEKALTQTRRYTTLIEVLGDVGGLMEVLLTVLNIILSFIIDNLYEKTLINNLFEFDLDKKIIIIKENKRKKPLFITEEIPKIYSPRKPMPSTPKSSTLSIDDNTLSTKNKINEEPSSNNRLKKDIIFIGNQGKQKKRKKKKLKISSNNPENNQVEVINIKGKKGEKNNDIYNIKNMEKFDINNIDLNKAKKMERNLETRGPYEKRRIVDKIKMNKCCTYFCFLCLRKRKNLENILLDEGMGIVEEKLDILNLFRKMVRDDTIKEKIKESTIEMSDTCKVNIHNVLNKTFNTYNQ